ncbi:MAG: oligopeptide:H+ symporter [Myxococcota bacterium]
MTTATADQDTLFGHPKGLYILFFTELWERFSYYGMRALLVLYLTAPMLEGPLGGQGWEEERAFALYGTYTMFVYLAAIPGGFIADRLLGQKRSVMLGGLTLCAGHLVLAAPGMTAFYAGLVLIVLGVGLLKPNISSMVGDLYAPGDLRRDKGFNIFYMGINVGALLSSIAVGFVGG